MSDPSYIPESVLQSIRDTVDSGRTLTSVLVGVYVWEIMTTIHLEYRLIWRKKVSFVTLAYLVARYWTLVAFSVSLWLMYIPASLWSSVCPKLVTWVAIAPVPALAAANCIMATRLYAIYGQSKNIAAICGVFICFIMGIQIAGPLLNHPLYTIIPPQLNISICVPNAEESHEWSYVLYSLSVTAYDLFALALVTWTSRINLRHSPSVVIKVLVRDPIVFFLLCAICTTLNSIYFLAVDQNKAQLAGLPVIMQPIAICRIVLNLKNAAAEPDSTSVSIKANYGSNVGTGSCTRQTGQSAASGVTGINLERGLASTKEEYELSFCSSPRSPHTPQTPRNKVPKADEHRQEDADSLEKQPVNPWM